MSELKDILQQHKDNKIMLYGLGTETERFINEWGTKLKICGLLDGFREDGEMFGYPIMSLKRAIELKVGLIVVIARPGSCKAITKRIGGMCKDNDIVLYDVRGRDLLAESAVSFDFSKVEGRSRQELADEISKADVVSFDLFDTLVMRKVSSYTDVFELVELELKNRGIDIPDLSKLRLSAEKELSKHGAPVLTEIYEYVLKMNADVTVDRADGCVHGSTPDASELSEIEWLIDRLTMVPRREVCKVFKDAVAEGKHVVVTTDSYYHEAQIREILDGFAITGYEKIFVSCEHGTSKTQALFERVLEFAEEKCGDIAESDGPAKGRILHIGDDLFSDIETADEYGIRSFRIFSGMDLFDFLGGMGTETCCHTISDRVKVGQFISRLFNSPFWFDDKEKRIAVHGATEVGYLFCAPMITDFVLWMKERMDDEKFQQILFCARDGYLVKKLYERVDDRKKSEYFLTSRTAAIRAGIESEEDIDYVNSMKYFGSAEDALKVRFGINGDRSGDNSMSEECGSDADNYLNKEILKKAETQRQNYKKYIDSLSFSGDKLALFDFVAKGTTQLFLQKIFDQHLKGFYFLQLEPEFMSDKGLDIEPFYVEEEKNTSVIYDNYYILETILTAPYPQLLEFDEDGKPLYAAETRSDADIKCFEKMQTGIEEFFNEYIRIVPDQVRNCNKQLDEAFLSMVNHILIMDDDFNRLKVEDPFFGRMTNITDVIG